MASDGWSFETKQIHSGAAPDPTTGARATPIYQTTSFVFRDTQHGADLFSLAEPGNIYTRINNPTQDVLEQRVAALEGGVAAVALASGQAAGTATILTLARSGDHLVSSASLYGGTYNLFHYTLPKLGIEVTFIDDPDNLDEWRAAVRPNTKLLFSETLGNPRSNVLDIEAVAAVAHEAGVPLVVDNTVPTPYLLRPLEHGADIVVHSATKYLGGHGTAVAGVVVDGGTFDFGANAERFPDFHEPDPSYHGLQYWPVLGHGAFAAKLRVQILRDTGAAIAPLTSFLILQGIETLSLRLERHVANAQALA
jgi:O-acetylhomoserine (thiol)-lyase